MVKHLSCKSNIIILLFLTAVAALANLPKWNEINLVSSYSHSSFLVEAFAAKGGGGFGGGGFGASPKTKNKKKVKKKIENLTDMMETITTKKESPNESIASGDTKQPKLDKWGLPETTLEDIFPPFQLGTK